MTFLYKKPTILALILLFFMAFAMRMIVLHYGIYPFMYYHQADSQDYHIAAVLIKNGHGMLRPDMKQPIFWRTPGYPFFLSFFYPHGQLNTISFEYYRSAHYYALLCQVFLNSIVPLLLMWLAFIMTSSWCVAWFIAIIAIIHVGLVLSSVFLLSEGPSMILFYGFLIFLFRIVKERPYKIWNIVVAALLLGVFTWIRPMGEWVGMVTIGVLLFASRVSFSLRLGAVLLFTVIFGIVLMPWYIRNYTYTHKLFFNPTLGPYLNCFVIPKILRRTHGITIEKALTLAQTNAAMYVQQVHTLAQPRGLYASPEECKKYAVPLIMQYPYYALYDWIVQCIKTAFDLYSCQLGALIHNEHTWDPIEEFLDKKVISILWSRSMPLSVRICAWVELLWMLIVWCGIFLSLVQMISAYIRDRRPYIDPSVWMTAFIVSLLVISMTGGFGYARLRLPIEPLLIIISIHALLTWKNRNLIEENSA